MSARRGAGFRKPTPDDTQQHRDWLGMVEISGPFLSLPVLRSVWPTLDAAQKAHNEEWRQAVIKRTGAAPTIRYFDLFLLIDNEHGTVTEFPAAAEIKADAA